MLIWDDIGYFVMRPYLQEVSKVTGLSLRKQVLHFCDLILILDHFANEMVHSVDTMYL